MRTRPSRLGCLSSSAMIAAAVVAILVAGIYFLAGAGLFSPGPLSAQAASQPAVGVSSHAEITDCAQCHPAPWSGQVMSDRCLACHIDVQQDPKNFHNLLFTQDQLKTCNGCHTEHHGVNASLTLATAARDIQHDKLGYSLWVHAKMADGSAFQCTDCHKTGYGAGSFDQSVCATCHASLDAAFITTHLQDFGTNCLACHDGIDTYGRVFNHTRVAFSLTGKHTTTACGQCHPGARDLAALKAAPQTCRACHAKDDIHHGDMGSDCGQCHTPDGWQLASIDHSQTAFPLAGKHAAVPCLQCHFNNIFKGTPTACFACHAKDDAHQGDLGQDCVTCHNPVSWAMASLDHNLTAFKLIGKHQTVACANCHANDVFKGTPVDCYSCHARDDNHKGTLGTDCSICHTPAGWLPSTFNHALSIFPLTGAHSGLPCTRCHVSGANGIVFKGTPTNCSACHSDPAYHAGLFGLDCAACHSTANWTQAKFDRPHKFEVHHGDASGCQDCHPANLNTYTCTKCHPGGAPRGDSGGG